MSKSNSNKEGPDEQLWLKVWNGKPYSPVPNSQKVIIKKVVKPLKKVKS